MRITILGLFIIALIGFSSCQKEEQKNADELLIEAIKKASNKYSIGYSELPDDSRFVLEAEYADSYIDDTKLAPKLGYEIDLSGEIGYKEAKYIQAYFDLTGRELKSGKEGKGDKGDKGCFDFVYPITYVMPDRTTITGNSKEEISVAMKAWYEAHPDSKEKPLLQYPVDIVFGDKLIILNNDKELEKAYELCKGDKGNKRKCFVLVYPITYVLPDDSDVTVSSKDDKDAWSTIKDWYTAHPDVVKKPALGFPIDIKWRDGHITTINNREQMKRAKASCDGDKEKCFELVYPVTYTMPDGTEIPVRINNEEGWANVKAWYREHPDSKKRPSIKYPVDITYEDGASVTINNQDQMKRAHEACD